MIHIHDAIRRHLEAGRFTDKYVPRSPQEKELLDKVRELADNRMEMGCFRYGRLDEYLRTHNTELLLDVMNLARIEFMYPTFNDAVFEPIDDGIHCANAKE